MTTPDRRRKQHELVESGAKRTRKDPHGHGTPFHVCGTENLIVHPEKRSFGYNGPAALAIVKETRWRSSPRLTVSFIDNPAPDLALQRKIVKYMNEWSKYTSAAFMLVAQNPMTAQVRVMVAVIKFPC